MPSTKINKKSKKYKIGLIVDTLDIDFLTNDLLLKSDNSKVYEITTIIRQNIKKPSLINYVKTKGILRLINALAFKFLTFVEKLLILPIFGGGDVFRSYKLDIEKFTLLDVYPKVSGKGSIYRYLDRDINTIKKLKLDTLVRCGSGILRGKILKVCKYGIISLHHGDNQFYRGGPPAFWEVLHRSESTGFIVQRLNETLDGGEVLWKGNVQTEYTYIKNLIRIYKKSTIFLFYVLENLNSNYKCVNNSYSLPYTSILYTIPSITNQLKYLFLTFCLIGKKIYNRSFKKGVRWNVGFQYVDTWRKANLAKANYIKNPKNKFLADPFVTVKDGKYFCFLEEYDSNNRKGSIVVYDLTTKKPSRLGVVLKEKFHLSYPYVFMEGNQLFMVPETNEVREVRIYKCKDFPLKWELYTTALHNISAVDTSIFYYEGKWWMFTNVDSANISDFSSELHIYYSKDLKGPWISHPKNPVIFNSKFSRNGGLIIDGLSIHRVFQQQGFDTYGKTFGLATVKKLSVFDYKEEVIFVANLDFDNGLIGSHTFGYEKGLVVFDYAKMKRWSL